MLSFAPLRQLLTTLLYTCLSLFLHTTKPPEVIGSSVQATWGKKGTPGQTRTKDWSSPEEAEKKLAKTVLNKMKKGYVLNNEDGCGVGLDLLQQAAAKKKPAVKRKAAAATKTYSSSGGAAKKKAKAKKPKKAAGTKKRKASAATKVSSASSSSSAAAAKKQKASTTSGAAAEDDAETTISPMLAHTWKADGKKDPADFLISEKLDGMRAIWNGKKMTTRTGTNFL